MPEIVSGPRFVDAAGMRDRRLRAETLLRLERERAPHGFVGGLDVQSEGNQTVEVLAATNGAPMGRCPIAHARDIEKSAEAARSAAAAYEACGPEPRALALEQLAQSLEEHTEDLAILECLQTGRSYRELLRDDLEAGAQLLRAAAAWTRAPEGTVHDLGQGHIGIVELAPWPVHGAVLPGAEPLASVIRHVALSVAAGSGLVVLAPHEAPLAVLRFAGLTRESSLPPGAVNVLTSDGREAPERLAESPSVDALDFAGSRELARRVLVGAAKSNLKPVALELDDKTPCFVFSDADIGRAVDAIWRSALTSPCQLGRSIGRVLVHQRLYADVASRLANLARATVVGHPLDEHNELGPLASAVRMKQTLAYIELGRREGAKLVAGGSRDVEGERYGGSYVQPTVFVDPPVDGRLVREPIAGPVVTIEPFEDEEDALNRAATRLGQGGAVVFTRDSGRAQRFGRKLGVGQIWINGPVRLHAALPHARAGESARPLLGRMGVLARGLPRTVVISGGR